MSISRMYIRSEFDRATVQLRDEQRVEHILPQEAAIDIQHISSEQVEDMFCRGEYKKWDKPIHFLFAHKEGLKKVPILGRIMVKRKNQMLQKELNQQCRRAEVDMSDCMGWFVDDFITACYQRLLGRTPDLDGLAYYQSCMRDGASCGTVVYMITRSDEFRGRAKVKHQKEYRREYAWYVCKRTILRVPLVGHILALLTIPNTLKKLYGRIARNEALILDSSARQMQQYAILQGKVDEISQQLLEQQGDVLKKVEAISQQLNKQQDDVLKKGEEILQQLQKQQTDILRTEELISQIDSMLLQVNEEQESKWNKSTEYIQQTVRLLEDCRQTLTMGVSIATAISEKIDTQAGISSIISKKLDELPAFIAANNISSHTAVTGIPGGVIGIIADGFTMGVPAEEWGVAMYLSQVGHFEVGTERFFEMLLKPGMTVLDLGANLGMFTLRALRAGCKVFSYEPTPRTSEILRQNIKVNGFAESGRSYVMQMAVSNVCGSTMLFENSKMCGHNSLFGEEEEMQQSVIVETVTLDSQQDLLGPVDIIKMDIEGAEYYALCGMRMLLKRNPQVQIIMEFAPVHLKRANVSPEMLLQMIREMGFSTYIINEVSAEAEVISDEELLRVDTVNLYLKREG